MANKEATELLDTARMLRADATKNGFDFLNNELDLSKTFAKRAWSLCATGHLSEAKIQALAATQAYQTAKQFLPNLGINAEQREQLSLKVGIVTPLIERLATIT
jgi:TPP-dependent indolepyruvate ferredoxin oxidoreductase alpha subunit